MRGRVAIGVVPSVGGWLSDTLAAFHGEHPGVEITLVEATSDELGEGVLSGRLDLAVAGLAGDPPGGLESLTIADEELVAAVAPEHSLARRRTRGGNDRKCASSSARR